MVNALPYNQVQVSLLVFVIMLPNLSLTTEEHLRIQHRSIFVPVIEGVLLIFGHLDLSWDLFFAYGRYHTLVLGNLQTVVNKQRLTLK